MVARRALLPEVLFAAPRPGRDVRVRGRAGGLSAAPRVSASRRLFGSPLVHVVRGATRFLHFLRAVVCLLESVFLESSSRRSRIEFAAENCFELLASLASPPLPLCRQGVNKPVPPSWGIRDRIYAAPLPELAVTPLGCVFLSALATDKLKFMLQVNRAPQRSISVIPDHSIRVSQ